MKEVEEWLIQWFKKNTNLDESDIIKNLNENYFLRNWIDSLKFIEIITDIEEHFVISFTNDEFQNRIFSTLTGLTRIIKGKING